MANFDYKVEISGIKIVNRVLKNMQETVIFDESVTDDYKKGFNDCMNAIISATEELEQEETEKSAKVPFDEKEFSKFIEEANEASLKAMERYNKHHKTD